MYICLHRMIQPENGGRKERTETLICRLAEQMPDVFGGRSHIRLIRSAAGAPLAEGYPELHISVSHSGEWWICAVSGMAVGIDIEYPRYRKSEDTAGLALRLMHLARRFFTPEEADYIEESCGDEKRTESFLQIWTAREAYVKYLGTGVDAGFRQLSVLPGAGEGCMPDSFSSGLTQANAAWKARGVQFEMVSLPAGAEEYQCCLCSEREGNIVVREF